ncbi:MAG TPA: prepilin peptidase [Gemmatimonadales bacterium]|nr:prepilin peptidase [Gemmatimonadales bacterium]
MSESSLLAIIAGIFGLLIGSFLNVCIVRLPAEQSVVTPRSRCPTCGKPVEWHDNIPVLSWLLLGGKCRDCRAPIGIMYPLVELAVGGLWALVALRYGVGVEGLKAAVFGTLLLGIALTDAREYIIPDEFTWGGLILGLVLSAAGGIHALLLALFGAAVGFAILWLVGLVGKRVFKEEAMGGGDIKMMAMVGAFLGWQGVLLTIFLGALAGSAIFLPLALVGRKKLVPFGVFLALGAAVTFLVGPAILLWYRRYLGVG